MRKVLTIILTLAVCIGLCACGSKDCGDSLDRIKENTEKIAGIAETTSLNNPEKYVGVWVSTNYTANEDEGLPYSFELFGNGKVLIQDYKNNWTVDELPWSIAGTWMLANDRLIIFYEEHTSNTAYDAAYVFHINTDAKLELKGFSETYTKKK